MTKEESIKVLTQYIDYDAETPDYYEMEKACKVAIKALEQEPCEELYRLITDSNSLMLLENYKTGERTVIEKRLEPCEDCISRQAVDRLAMRYLREPTDKHVAFYEEFIELPPVTPKPKTGHCKECKYFEYDSVLVEVDGIPLLVHNICKKWSNGCKTNENGYCFLFEPRESEDKE